MKVYFMGIGGVAMGNAALLAKQMGDNVCGTDGPLYPPMSEALKDLEVYNGYSAERLEKLKPDAVIIGNAIARGNPELEWFWDKKPFKYYSLPEFLRERVLSKRRTIAVCGTHGKTTTTTIAAYLLYHNKTNPGWLIGGVPQDLPTGACAGKEDGTFVIEGDEYDSVFFDKRAKFISYQPTAAVLNNLELDHLDIYRDIDDLKRVFNHLLRTIPASGIVIANRDDANIRSLLPVKWVNTLWVGVDSVNQEAAHTNQNGGELSAADLLIKNYKETPEGSSFELIYKGKLWGKVEWSMGGLFNARNAAMAALAAGWSINPQDPSILNLSCLKNFVGVKRRQEIRFKSEELMVVEDFAHHPTAVELTLTSMRARFPKLNWVACIEPRSNTSRTNIHQEEYAKALSLADVAILPPVYRADLLTKEKRLDIDRLAKEISENGKKAICVSSCKEIPDTLSKILADGKPTGIVFFSNGSFEGALPAFLQTLEQTTKL